MKHMSLDNIYNEIMLLSDADRKKLYNRMKKEFNPDREIVAYTTVGKSLTKKEYVEKIERAIAEADKGKLISDEELEKEIATW